MVLVSGWKESKTTVGPQQSVTIVSPYEGEIMWSLGDKPSNDPLVGSYQCSVEDTVEELLSKGVNREQVLIFQQDF